MFRLLKAARAFFILLPLHLALAARSVAQETARIDEPVVVAGVVRDGSSNPVRDAVVTIVDLARSTRTDDAGVFRLELPTAAGGRELVLRVSLGRLAETEARVVAGTGTTWRDVVLDVPVVPLQAVVATAVGVADHRAQPARIGRVDAVSVVESAPVATMTELLQARMPGLSVTRASGAPGAASQIRTRGVGPLRFPGGPAVYVDGVRVDAGLRESMLVVAPATSGLDDLSPHDIESVEVLAGPAAAARYGPDAVTGVIAVRTRRAPVGEQPFRQQIAAGYGRTEVAAAPPDNWARCTDASVPVCEGLAAGTLVSDNPLMREGGYREGRRASIHWSGRGGGANYGFSMGLGLETEDGYLPATGLDRRNGHASLVLVPTERLRVEAGIGRAVSKVEPVLAEGYAGLIGLGMLGSPLTVSGPADGWWGTPGEIFATAESRIEAERTTPTLRLAHTTLPWLTQRLTAGADLVRQSGRQAFPWIEEWPDLEGQFADAKRRSDVYTVDYLATAEVPLESPDVSDSRLSLGVQYLRESSRRSGTEGVRTDPPTDSEPFEWTEREIEWRTAGVLAQWDIGYRDRLFARVGARVDWMRLEYRDSAYAGATGSPSSSSASYAKDDPDPVVAPYVGVSYLVSNTSFWAPIAPVVGTLRLHGAWGRARRKHPDLEVQDFDDDILFMLSTISAARPETVNEFELGAEAGLLDDRLGIGITYFHRTTSDIALLIPSSLGLGVGRVGYGEVVDRGFELDLTARLLRGSALSWTVDAMLRTLDNEVESIGSDLIEAASIGGTSPLPGHPAGIFLRPGLPAGAFFGSRILEIDTVANVVQLSERQSLGSPVPEVEAAVSTHLTIGRRIRLYGLLDARGGYRVYNRTAFFRDQLLDNSERAARWPELPAEERIRYFGTRLDARGGPPTYEPYYEDGSFVRLREVAVTFALPAPWAARLGASGASFTIGGRNLAIWTDYEGGDPEVLSDPASPLNRADLFTPPQARRWEARLTVQF